MQVECTPESHNAIKADPQAWSLLKPIGVMVIDDTEALEMRNCACGSTLCKSITAK